MSWTTEQIAEFALQMRNAGAGAWRTRWTRDGSTREETRVDYPGFHTRSMEWESVRAKFDRLTAAHDDPALQDEIAAAVAGLEHGSVADLMASLKRVGRPGRDGAGSRA